MPAGCIHQITNCELGELTRLDETKRSWSRNLPNREFEQQERCERTTRKRHGPQVTHPLQTENIQTTETHGFMFGKPCAWTARHAIAAVGRPGTGATITDPPGFMSGKPGARTVHMETPRPAIATADRTGSWATFSQSLRHMIHVWQPCARTVHTEAPRDVIATKDRTAIPHSLRHKGSCNHRLT